ncbi:hypothetical protein EMGR_008023 [Emarellia grisea]
MVPAYNPKHLFGKATTPQHRVSVARMLLHDLTLFRRPRGQLVEDGGRDLCLADVVQDLGLVQALAVSFAQAEGLSKACVSTIWDKAKERAVNTNWIDDALRLNTHIVAAEGSFDEQVTNLIAASAQGQDTAELEVRLATHQRRIFLMRRLQARLLQAPVAKA